MPRVSFLLALVVLSAHLCALAQHSTPSPADVVYVTRDFSDLQAYDVDPKTGIPTAVGPAVVISASFERPAPTSASVTY